MLKENDTYLIDSDSDTEWDHAYNQETGELLTYSEYIFDKVYKIFLEEYEAPGFELISVLAMIALLLIIMKRRRKNK